jgi:hypothetical protein
MQPMLVPELLVVFVVEVVVPPKPPVPALEAPPQDHGAAAIKIDEAATMSGYFRIVKTRW